MKNINNYSLTWFTYFLEFFMWDKVGINLFTNMVELIYVSKGKYRENK